MSTTAQDWAEGYVTDIEYVHNFHAGLVPLNLALAAMLGGVRPPDVDAPFAYLDLGCGNGFTPALLAASHPHARIVANDFNPAHIRNARATAEAAGVGNVTFLEASFADLLETDLPPFDIVVAHGIWSWVNQANRDRIVDLLAHRVKPGGLVLISYNCHPGWDSLLPLRRLLVTTAGQHGTRGERIDRALAAARRLRDAGADYFRNAPAASAMLDQLLRADHAYLAHEYLNAEWSLFYPAEVAAAVQPAGLSYVGQARAIDGCDDFFLTPNQQALLAAASDTAEAEAWRDLILDRRFRYDLFVRDGARGGEEEQDAWFAHRRFTPARPRSECSLTLETRLGEVYAGSALLVPILDVLAQGVATGAALAGHAALGGARLREVRSALTVLIGLGHVQPALAAAGEPVRRAATERFNAAALDALRMGEPFAALASPVTGAGVALVSSDQLLLDAWRIGIPLEAITLEGDDTGARAARFRNALLPMLARLGIA